MPNPLLPLALAGAIFVCGALKASAEASSACALTAPRYETKAHKRPVPEEIKFLGGARVVRPVAEPCPRGRREADA